MFMMVFFLILDVKLFMYVYMYFIWVCSSPNVAFLFIYYFCCFNYLVLTISFKPRSNRLRFRGLEWVNQWVSHTEFPWNNDTKISKSYFFWKLFVLFKTHFIRVLFNSFDHHDTQHEQKKVNIKVNRQMNWLDNQLVLFLPFVINLICADLLNKRWAHQLAMNVTLKD